MRGISRPARVFELTEGNAAAFLGRGACSDRMRRCRWSGLGGGISNVVLRVLTPDDCLVLKQPLAKLRVASDWPFDRGAGARRAPLHGVPRRRAAAGRGAAGPLLRSRGVRAGDELRAAGGRLWKEALLAGDVEVGAAELAGDLLGRIHALALRDAAPSSRRRSPPRRCWCRAGSIRTTGRRPTAIRSSRS